MTTNYAWICGLLAAVWLAPAAAQQQNNARPHPADPAAAVPAVRHSSAFAGYQPLGNEKPAAWREANDEVARAGGHIGILKAASADNAGGHAGHHPGAGQ